MPLLGIQAEGARTNLIKQSGDQTNVLYTLTGVTSAKNSTGSDGTTSMTTLTELAPATAHYVYFADAGAVGVPVSAGSTAAFSIDLKAGTRRYVVVAITSGANGVGIVVDTQTWTISSTYNSGVGSGAAGYISPVQYANGVRRISVVGALAGLTAYYPLVGGANTSTNTHVSTYAGDGSTVITGAWQLEVASFASSHIATTTIAVAKNPDIDSATTSGNITAAAGSVYLEFTPTHSPSGTIAFWGTYVDASNYTAILHDATNLIFRKRIAGVNYDATIANAFVSGTTYKACATWGTAGTSITLNGTEGTPHANTTAAQIAATMQWGADGNSLQQPFASIRNCRDWLRQLSASERAAVTV